MMNPSRPSHIPLGSSLSVAATAQRPGEPRWRPTCMPHNNLPGTTWPRSFSAGRLVDSIPSVLSSRSLSHLVLVSRLATSTIALGDFRHSKAAASRRAREGQLISKPCESHDLLPTSLAGAKLTGDPVLSGLRCQGVGTLCKVVVLARISGCCRDRTTPTVLACPIFPFLFLEHTRRATVISAIGYSRCARFSPAAQQTL